MTYLQSIFLGALQGVSEFLPISSSGHLKIFKEFMNIQDTPMIYDVLLHVATLLVVCIVFYKRIWAIIKSLFRLVLKKNSDEDIKNIAYFIIIIIATVITGIMGLILNKVIGEFSPIFVSILFIITGLILLSTYFLQKYKNRRKIEPLKLNYKNSLLIGTIVGVAQGIGVLPGISRSGITVSSALFANVDKKNCGDISFLISIPAILGALILKISEGGLNQLSNSITIPVLITGLATSLIVGFASLILLLKLIRSGKFYLFSFYLFAIGIFGTIYFSIK